MTSFAETLLANLWTIIEVVLPFRVVRVYQRGVKFRLGILKPTLEPGFHWIIPMIDQVDIVDVNQETKNLPNQSVTTKDGKAVTFSVNIIYETLDAALLFTAVQSHEESFTAVAMVHMAQRIREWEWHELLEGQKDLEKSLRDTLTTRVKPWGIRIVGVGITDLTQARPIRIITGL
jgi:regulator of protease activity HflC (stomatin/prohibitin superfamily)